MRTSTTSTKSTTLGRAAAAVAVTALAGLVSIAPAQAGPDAGTGPDDLTPADVRVWESSRDQAAGGSITQPGRTQLLPTDDNAVEYLQVALGALGGMAVVGAVIAGSSRRHGHAHPA